MLGKLFKYEIKATARLFIPLYLTVIAFAAINRLFLLLLNLNENKSKLLEIAMGISMVVFVTLMIGVVLMSLLVMIQRFYKNLLGDEGYLMFTLPVQSHKHIFSKLTVSMIWTILSSIVALLSILIISSKEILTPEFYQGISMAFNQIKSYLGGFTYLVGVEVILLILLSLASTILTIYAAISLGHLFSKYKLLISFGMYIILNTISQILMTIFMFVFASPALFGAEINTFPSIMQFNSFILVTLLYYVILAVGYFTLTNYLLKRKLNLE